MSALFVAVARCLIFVISLKVHAVWKIKRDNDTPARGVKDLCPIKGFFVPPERAIDQ